MHIFLYIDLLQSGPKDEPIPVDHLVVDPDIAIKEPLEESAMPTLMLQSSDMAPSHQPLSQVDLMQPLSTSILPEVAPYSYQHCFEVS